MNIEYKTLIFENQMRELINNSQLPPILIYYVLKDMVNDISNVVYESQLMGEKEEWDKKYPNGKQETKEIPPDPELLKNILDKNEKTNQGKNQEKM